jgi:hypothetical protein
MKSVSQLYFIGQALWNSAYSAPVERDSTGQAQ